MNIPMQCNPLSTRSNNPNSPYPNNPNLYNPSSPSPSPVSPSHSATVPSQPCGNGSSTLQRQALALKLSSSMQLAKCGISPAWGLKNPTFEAVMRNYSPANWGVVAQSARRAYLWVCPTVGALAPLFGPRCPVMWLDEQVTHLFLTSQSRDASAAAAQIEAFVGSFVGTVAEFKLTEVMLFLARYKAGVYGRSFAAFDVRNVGQTFHHEFVPQRRLELQAIEAEATAGRDGEERRLRAAHAVSREAYLQLQRNGGRVGLKVWLRAAALSASRVCGVAQLLGTRAEALATTAAHGQPLSVVVDVAQLPAVARAEAGGLLRVADSWVCSTAADAKAMGQRRAHQP